MNVELTNPIAMLLLGLIPVALYFTRHSLANLSGLRGAVQGVGFDGLSTSDGVVAVTLSASRAGDAAGRYTLRADRLEPVDGLSAAIEAFNGAATVRRTCGSRSRRRCRSDGRSST